MDEAWKKRGNPEVSGDKDVYFVDMGRAVGKDGESKIKLVFERGSSAIVTAHPAK